MVCAAGSCLLRIPFIGLLVIYAGKFTAGKKNQGLYQITKLSLTQNIS